MKLTFDKQQPAVKKTKILLQYHVTISMKIFVCLIKFLLTNITFLLKRITKDKTLLFKACVKPP